MFRPGFRTVGRILSRRFCSQAAAARSPSSRPAGARLLHLHSQRNVGVAAATTAPDHHSFGFFRSCIAITSAWCCVGLGLACMRKIEESRAERSARPSKIDWVEAGVVSPDVRNQKSCGACWAMAVVASVEAAHFIKTSRSIALSVQELVDCCIVNYGYNGGRLLPAIWYIWRKGLSSESSYPYVARSNFCCRKGNKKVAARISGFRFISRTEDALEKAVAKQPVVVILQSSDDLHDYKGGIMEYKALPAFNGGHPVLIVGYVTDPDSVKFWRFKNSWGEGWGEGGFGRIRHGYVYKTRTIYGGSYLTIVKFMYVSLLYDFEL